MESNKIVNLQEVSRKERRKIKDRRKGNAKILDLHELEDKTTELRNQGKKIVLCHGTFDLLHIGHIRHLQRAREEGDVLLVTVTADSYVNKGPGRPVFNHDLRMENLAALECVDFVAVNYETTSVNVLHQIKPHVYVKGSDYKKAGDDVTGNITKEREAVELHGGRIFYTQEITNSSSHLLNEHFQVFSPEVKAYLEEFKTRFTFTEINQALQTLKALNVLVIGDAIIDEYHYTSPLGQIGKGNVLAVKYNDEEKFAGGSIAVANHVAGFAGNVTLVAGLGMKDSQEDFIGSKLLRNVSPVFFKNPSARTLTKRRYIGDEMSKLFEVYFYDEDISSEDVNSEVCVWLNSHLEQFDAVIVPDFGNGFVTNDMVTKLTEKSRFLAVNTQVNSGNRGYHLITRYPHADFVSLNEPELRMAACDKSADLEVLARKIATQMGVEQLAVTRGKKGVLMIENSKRTRHDIPALSTSVVDRIGAGDAFLSLTSLCLVAGLGAEMSAFVGSIAGAMDVQIVCNREPVNPVSLVKYVDTLLK